MTLEFGSVHSAHARYQFGATQRAVSWTTNSSGYALQNLPDLSSTNWANVSTPIIVSGTNNTVTITNATANSFFRLKK